MRWSEIEPQARAGLPVRRETWPSSKTLTFSAGGGTVRAVAMIVQGSTQRIVNAEDFGRAEFEAIDWRLA